VCATRANKEQMIREETEARTTCLISGLLV
jgi:hypothetical protein